jgi:hypothetical protein
VLGLVPVLGLGLGLGLGLADGIGAAGPQTTSEQIAACGLISPYP